MEKGRFHKDTHWKQTGQQSKSSGPLSAESSFGAAEIFKTTGKLSVTRAPDGADSRNMYCSSVGQKLPLVQTVVMRILLPFGRGENVC